DRHQPVAAIAVAVIGIANQERPVGVRFVVVIAVPVIDGFGVADVAIARLPGPGLHPAVAEAVIGRGIAEHAGQHRGQRQQRVIARAGTGLGLVVIAVVERGVVAVVVLRRVIVHRRIVVAAV